MERWLDLPVCTMLKYKKHNYKDATTKKKGSRESDTKVALHNGLIVKAQIGININ